MPNPLARIADKVHSGERLSFDDGMELEASRDPFALGELANIVRERKNGNITYYNVNEHLNPTNVCVYRCSFCSFRADLQGANAYVMSDDEILGRAREATLRGCTELHVVGGLHHQLPYEWYLGIIAGIHREFPDLHLKAWTAVEWDWFERLTKRPTRDLLDEMKAAGLGSLPGGGAEIFHPEVREKICDYKADADQWLRVHREWHQMGGKSNATMLYGHIEKPEHRIDHLLRLRRLQDETGGFQTFIPLAFHPENNPLGEGIVPGSAGVPPASGAAAGTAALPGIAKPSGMMDLKVMAIARLMLDNFPHVKAYWQMLSVKIAQVAQSWGADDIDGTVVHEKIYHAAGSDSPQELTVNELRRLIEEAGRVPVERDTLYNEVVRNKPADPQWQAGRRLVTLN